MGWSWDGIDFTVEFAFGDAPLAASYTYTDVSDYVRDVPSIFRGKTSELDDLSPGHWTILLYNGDRRFDPDYSSGAYYPDVVPMVPVRLKATFATVTYVVATGFVLGWRQIEDGPGAGLFVEVTCVDGTRFMRNNQLAGSAYEAEVMADDPSHWFGCQSTDDMYDRITGRVELYDLADTDSGHASPTYLERLKPIGNSSALIGQATSFAGDGSGFQRAYTVGTDDVVGDARTIEFWAFVAAAPVYDSPISINVNNGSGWSLHYEALPTALTNGSAFYVYYSHQGDNEKMVSPSALILAGYLQPGRIHHVVITVSSSTATLYIDGVATDTDTVTGAPYASVGSSVVVQAIESAGVSNVITYASALSAARVLAHYNAGATGYGHSALGSYGERGGARIGRVLDEIGWPTARRDLDAGATRQGPYLPAGAEAIDYIRQVEAGEQGVFAFDVDGNARFIDRIALAQAASVATFSDDGAAGAIQYESMERDGNHIDTMANIVTTSYSSVGAITRSDATSIAAYDAARKFIDAPTIPNGKTASACSAYALRLGKDPASRVSSLVAPMRLDTGDNEADKLLSIDLGDIVTVERTPGGVGSQVVKRLIVQGIEHEITLEQWRVRLYLSPAPPAATDVPYFELGDATYGRLGAAYGNALIY